MRPSNDCCERDVHRVRHPPGMQLPVLIALAAQIAGVSADPATLVANAKCLECGIPPGMQLSVLIYLACQIANK